MKLLASMGTMGNTTACIQTIRFTDSVKNLVVFPISICRRSRLQFQMAGYISVGKSEKDTQRSARPAGQASTKN